MIKKFSVLFLMLILILLTMTGCIPGDGTHTITHQAGFFWGVWHGWIAPISLLIGLFDHHISIYETYNTGWFYDLGFYAAIISGFGGFSLSRKRRKNNQ